MRIASLCLLTACLLAATAVAASDPTCPDVDAPPAPVCIATPHGLAYADSEEEASGAARALSDAAQRFAGYFGRAPTGALVLSATLDPLVAREFARTHGLEFAQVWLPASANRAMTERALRQSGMARAQIQRALAGAATEDESTLRHEVGHAMYAALYWPNATGTRDARYGSPAPDWLDEASAILMEGPESQAKYAAMFLGVTRRNPRSTPSLAEFVASEHPVRSAALARALARGPKSTSGVQMVTVGGSEDFPGLDTFYGQSLLLGYFLTETSGDTRILAPISAAIADGATFEDWLAREGEGHRLPASMDALETAWNAWLEQLRNAAARRAK